MADVKQKEYSRLERAGRRLYEARLVAGSLGALGARLPSGSVTVTRQGARLGFLKQSDLLLLDTNGLPANGAGPATDDSGMLFSVLEACPQANAVLRVQPAFTTALSFGGRRKVERASRVMEHLGGVAFIPYYRPGTAGLAGAVAEALLGATVAIIERQGPVVRGQDIDAAADIAEALEAAAKVSFLISDNGDTYG